MSTRCEHRRGVGFCSLCQAGWSPEAAERIGDVASRARDADSEATRQDYRHKPTTIDAILSAKFDELRRDLGL